MRHGFIGVLTFWLLVVPAFAEDVIDARLLGTDLAVDIAEKAMHACREQGYQVSVVVVDRSGVVQTVMRDVLASRFTIQIAKDKANAVILSGVDSGSFRENRTDIREEMDHVEDILLLRGGLPIRAAGSIIGAVGVSGAPGGDKDETCARQALEEVAERLQFID